MNMTDLEGIIARADEKYGNDPNMKINEYGNTYNTTAPNTSSPKITAITNLWTRNKDWENEDGKQLASYLNSKQYQRVLNEGYEAGTEQYKPDKYQSNFLQFPLAPSICPYKDDENILTFFLGFQNAIERAIHYSVTP